MELGSNTSGNFLQMKTRHIWFEILTHDRKKSWRWKPSFLKSHIVYGLNDKAWKAPMWEISWLCFCFHWKAYNLKEEYRAEWAHHNCPADLMQERINELEEEVSRLRVTAGR